MYYDISISVFTALMVIMCTSLISYSIIKKRTLENFYEEMQYIIKKYIEMQDYNEEDLEGKIDGVLMLSEINYMEFDRAFSNIKFFFNRGKGREVVIDLYHYVKYIRETVSENKYHLKLHKKGKGTNHDTLLNEFIKPTYDLFFSSNTIGDNKNQVGTYIRHEVIEEIEKKMHNLYDYMYSKKYYEEGEKHMNRWHYFTKSLFQILLLVIEIGGFVGLFIIITSKYELMHNLVDVLERGVLGFAFYEIIIYIVLNMITDIKKDSYLALKSNYDLMLLYLETDNKNIEEKILKNIELQLDCGTFNSSELREEYKSMTELLNSRNINMIKYKKQYYELQYEAENLKWKYSILLRIFK